MAKPDFAKLLGVESCYALLFLPPPANLMSPQSSQCDSGKNHLNTSIDATEVALPTAQTKLMDREAEDRKQKTERQRTENRKQKTENRGQNRVIIFAMLFLPTPTNLITSQSSMYKWQKSPFRRL